MVIKGLVSVPSTKTEKPLNRHSPTITPQQTHQTPIRLPHSTINNPIKILISHNITKITIPNPHFKNLTTIKHNLDPKRSTNHVLKQNKFAYLVAKY